MRSLLVGVILIVGAGCDVELVHAEAADEVVVLVLGARLSHFVGVQADCLSAVDLADLVVAVAVEPKELFFLPLCHQLGIVQQPLKEVNFFV